MLFNTIASILHTLLIFFLCSTPELRQEEKKHIIFFSTILCCYCFFCLSFGVSQFNFVFYFTFLFSFVFANCKLFALHSLFKIYNTHTHTQMKNNFFAALTFIYACIMYIMKKAKKKNRKKKPAKKERKRESCSLGANTRTEAKSEIEIAKEAIYTDRIYIYIYNYHRQTHSSAAYHVCLFHFSIPQYTKYL